MIVRKLIRLQTRGNTDIIDITSRVQREVGQSGVKNGIVVVFVAGSTAALTTMEYEPGLIADVKEAFAKLAPQGVPYRHDLTWGDDNGHSHVRASLVGPSLVVPLTDGDLTMGTWQQLVLIDFDIRPREREIVVQIVGD